MYVTDSEMISIREHEMASDFWSTSKAKQVKFEIAVKWLLSC